MAASRLPTCAMQHAELAVGNTVRRVMHLIREESQVEDEEDLATARSSSASEFVTSICECVHEANGGSMSDSMIQDAKMVSRCRHWFMKISHWPSLLQPAARQRRIAASTSRQRAPRPRQRRSPPALTVCCHGRCGQRCWRRASDRCTTCWTWGSVPAPSWQSRQSMQRRCRRGGRRAARPPDAAARSHWHRRPPGADRTAGCVRG